MHPAKVLRLSWVAFLVLLAFGIGTGLSNLYVLSTHVARGTTPKAQVCPVLTMMEGQVVNLGAVGVNAEGDTVSSKIKYDSPTSDVVTVTEQGNVMALHTGRTTVSATATNTVSGAPLTNRICIEVRPRPTKPKATV